MLSVWDMEKDRLYSMYKDLYPQWEYITPHPMRKSEIIQMIYRYLYIKRMRNDN